MSQCRSGDCEEPAVFKAHMPGVGRSHADEWDGSWCQKHLMRVLELKLGEVRWGQTLVIRRID